MQSQAHHPAPERIIIESTLGRRASALCHGAVVHRKHAAAHRLVSQTRRELGLPVDSLIFMTGHQAELWHPGILAKYMTCEILAEHAKCNRDTASLSPMTSHVVVDQDVNDGELLRIPLKPVGRHTLSLRAHSAASQGSNTQDRREHGVMRVRPPVTPSSLTAFLADRSVELSAQVRGRLTQLVSWIESTSEQSNLAAQLAKIVSLAAQPFTTLGPGLFATSITQSSGFAWLLEQLQINPYAAASAYNESASRYPRARIAPLHVSSTQPGSTQLPLWHIDPVSGQRRTIIASELASLPLNQIAPKALLLTAFLRLFVCDLFIHGLGGGLYDQVTDAWIGSATKPGLWLNKVQMAPTATVTATLYLSFDVAPPPTPEHIAQAARQVHRARHDPRTVEADASTVSTYDRLIKSSQMAKTKTEKRAAYTALQDFLATYRTQHAAGINQLRALEAQLRIKSKLASLVYDRTWPFIFYSSSQLESLESSLESQLGVR